MGYISRTILRVSGLCPTTGSLQGKVPRANWSFLLPTLRAGVCPSPALDINHQVPCIGLYLALVPVGSFVDSQSLAEGNAIGFLFSEAPRLGLNHVAGIPGPGACKPSVLSCHNLMSQVPYNAPSPSLGLGKQFGFSGEP